MVHLKDVHYIEVIEPIPAKEDVDVDGYGYSIMEHEKNKYSVCIEVRKYGEESKAYYDFTTEYNSQYAASLAALDYIESGYGYSIMEHEKNKFLKGVVYEKNSKVF